EPGEIEEEFAHAGTARIIKRFLTSRSPCPPCIPKGGFRTSPNTTLPAWLCEEDVNYFVSKFDNRGFTGGLNYYRALDLYVPFTSLLKSFLVVAGTSSAAGKSGSLSLDALAKAKKALQMQKELSEKLKKIPLLNKGASTSSEARSMLGLNEEPKAQSVSTGTGKGPVLLTAPTSVSPGLISSSSTLPVASAAADPGASAGLTADQLCEYFNLSDMDVPLLQAGIYGDIIDRAMDNIKLENITIYVELRAQLSPLLS
ncbi:hypothetical protein CFP56_008859, partial [Quercus suber]